MPRYTVTVEQANGLRAADINGKSDPYVMVYLTEAYWGTEGKRVESSNHWLVQLERTDTQLHKMHVDALRLKTPVILKTLSPVWTEKNSIELEIPEGHYLEFRVWDKDTITADDFLGHVIIGPKPCLVAHSQDLELSGKAGKTPCTGTLRVLIKPVTVTLDPAYLAAQAATAEAPYDPLSRKPKNHKERFLIGAKKVYANLDSKKQERRDRNESAAQPESPVTLAQLQAFGEVKGVKPGSPGAAAGLLKGDLLLRFGDLTRPDLPDELSVDLLLDEIRNHVQQALARGASSDTVPSLSVVLLRRDKATPAEMQRVTLTLQPDRNGMIGVAVFPSSPGIATPSAATSNNVGIRPSSKEFGENSFRGVSEIAVPVGKIESVEPFANVHSVEGRDQTVYGTLVYLNSLAGYRDELAALSRDEQKARCREAHIPYPRHAMSSDLITLLLEFFATSQRASPASCGFDTWSSDLHSTQLRALRTACEEGRVAVKALHRVAHPAPVQQYDEVDIRHRDVVGKAVVAWADQIDLWSIPGVIGNASCNLKDVSALATSRFLNFRLSDVGEAEVETVLSKLENLERVLDGLEEVVARCHEQASRAFAEQAACYHGKRNSTKSSDQLGDALSNLSSKTFELRTLISSVEMAHIVSSAMVIARQLQDQLEAGREKVFGLCARVTDIIVEQTATDPVAAVPPPPLEFSATSDSPPPIPQTPPPSKLLSQRSPSLIGFQRLVTVEWLRDVAGFRELQACVLQDTLIRGGVHDFATLKMMTVADFEAMGIKVGPRRRLITALST